MNSAKPVGGGARFFSDDVDLKKMREKARKSKTVKELEKKAGINDKNFKSRVVLGNTTATPMAKNPTITIKRDTTLDEAVAGYAHELSNLLKIEQIIGINYDARDGKIATADEYADKMLSIETHSFIQQMLVSLELGLETGTDEGVVSLVKQYQKDRDYKKLYDKIYNMNARFQTDDGQNAREYYKEYFRSIPKRTK